MAKNNKPESGSDLLQLLTDPENQPHQFVGKPDELAALLEGPAQEKADAIIKDAEKKAAEIIKDAEKSSIADMDLDELNAATDAVKTKISTEAQEAEKELRAELFQKHGYELMNDVIYQKELLPAGSRNKLAKLKKAEISKLLEKGIIRK